MTSRSVRGGVSYGHDIWLNQDSPRGPSCYARILLHSNPDVVTSGRDVTLRLEDPLLSLLWTRLCAEREK